MAQRKRKTVKRNGGLLRALFTVLVACIVLCARGTSVVTRLARRALGLGWRSRPARHVAALAAGLIVVGGLAWVMEGHLQGEARYQIDPGRIALTADPTWARGNLARSLRQEIEQELRAELADVSPTHAFDDSALPLVRERLERNPWVRRVTGIERRFPTTPEGFSTLLPVLELRRPVLRVESGGGSVLLDGDGVVLPVNLPRDAAELSLFLTQLTVPLRNTVGVQGSPPAPGRAWQSEQVAAALSMERVLRRAALDRALPITTIELVGVPPRADALGRVHYASDGGIILVADREILPGTRVIWGRPPVHASTLELSPNEKLSRLRSRLAEPGSLAGAQIDLRGRG
jgi:hypothetical protein